MQFLLLFRKRSDFLFGFDRGIVWVDNSYNAKTAVRKHGSQYNSRF